MALCKCGCGMTTSIATKTSARWGIVRGQPVNYIKGHTIWNKPKDIDSMYQVEADTGCWTWTGNLEAGYGRIGQKLVYRLMYEQKHGPVPKGLELDHLCRNRACVNPEHLEPVTRRTNVRRGSAAKLHECLVFRVHEWTAEGMTRTAIAAELGVTPALISHIVTGRIWKDIYAVWNGLESEQ